MPQRPGISPQSPGTDTGSELFGGRGGFFGPGVRRRPLPAGAPERRFQSRLFSLEPSSLQVQGPGEGTPWAPFAGGRAWLDAARQVGRHGGGGLGSTATGSQSSSVRRTEALTSAGFKGTRATRAADSKRALGQVAGHTLRLLPRPRGEGLSGPGPGEVALGAGRSQGHQRDAGSGGEGAEAPLIPPRPARAPQAAAPPSWRPAPRAPTRPSRPGAGAGRSPGARPGLGTPPAPQARAPASRSPVARRRPWGAGLRGPAGRARRRAQVRARAGDAGPGRGRQPLTPPLSPLPPCVPPPRPSSPAPPQLGPWSWRGCRTVPLDALRTRCLCDRLSTFAILAQLSADAVRPQPGARRAGGRGGGARGGGFRGRLSPPGRLGEGGLRPPAPRGLAGGARASREGGWELSGWRCGVGD